MKPGKVTIVLLPIYVQEKHAALLTEHSVTTDSKNTTPKTQVEIIQPPNWLNTFSYQFSDHDWTHSTSILLNWKHSVTRKKSVISDCTHSVINSIELNK